MVTGIWIEIKSGKSGPIPFLPDFDVVKAQVGFARNGGFSIRATEFPTQGAIVCDDIPCFDFDSYKPPLDASGTLDSEFKITTL